MNRSLIVSIALVLAAVTCVVYAAAPQVSHSFLATGSETYIIEFASPDDQVGKRVWSFPSATRDGYALDNGNVLLTLSKGGDYPGGAVVEVTPDGNVTLRYKGTQAEVNSAQPLDNGGLVLTEAGDRPRLIELDADNNIVVEFPLECSHKNAHMQARMARKLPDGTYLVPQLLDFAVKQYDRTGKVIAVIDTTVEGDTERRIHTWPFTAIRLENGNTLCGLTQGNRVVEYRPDGSIAWQLTNDDLPPQFQMRDACGVQRLPNGNTVITSYAARNEVAKLIEVTPDKQVVWSYRDDSRRGIHHFQILTTNGEKLPGPPMK